MASIINHETGAGVISKTRVRARDSCERMRTWIAIEPPLNREARNEHSTIRNVLRRGDCNPVRGAGRRPNWGKPTPHQNMDRPAHSRWSPGSRRYLAG